jgi:hypothetical protein
VTIASHTNHRDSLHRFIRDSTAPNRRMNSHDKHRRTCNRWRESSEFRKRKSRTVRGNHKRRNSSEPKRRHHKCADSRRRATRRNRRKRVHPSTWQERRRKSERNSAPRGRKFHGSNMCTLCEENKRRWNTRRWNLHTKRSKHRDEAEERDRHSGGD